MTNYNLGSATGRIIIHYSDQGVGKAKEDMEGAKKQAVSTSSAFSKTATGMGTAGLAIAGGFALAVKSSADFEKVLSGISAVTGASTAQMEQLRKKALQLGADTAFSAKESAEAMEELAKAGISIPDILNGAADAAVNLAAAGGVALPEAAEIASAAMNSFKLTAKDLPGVADLIAGAANASAIDVHEFGTSLKQVGAVANLAGISFADTAAAIALMGTQGIKGSDAGTSLKTMLQNLIPETDKQKGLMKDLGLFTKEGGNAFFDAQGKAKSLSDIAGLLNKSLKDYTQEQKLATLGTLFGSDAIRAAAVLTDQGAAGFDKMSTSMGKVSAADVAKKRMDNLSGSIEQLKGSLETVMIQFGSGAQGPLKDFVDKLTDLVNWFNNLSDGTKQTIVTSALGVAAFLLFSAALIKTVQFVQNLIATLKVLSKAMHLQAIGKGIANIAKFIKQLVLLAARAATAGARILLMGVRMAAVKAAQFASAMASAARSLATLALSAARAGASMAVVAARAIATRVALIAIRVATLAWAAAQWLLNAALSANPIGLIIIAVIALVAAIIILWKKSETFRTIVIAVWNAIKAAFLAAVNFIVDFVKNHWQLLLAILTGPIGLVVLAIVKNWDKIKSIFSAGVDFVIAYAKLVWGTLWKILTAPYNLAVTLIAGALKLLQRGITAALNSIIGALGRFGSSVKSKFNSVVSFLGSIGSKIGGIFKKTGTWLYNAGKNLIQGLINGAVSLLNKLYNIFKNITDKIPRIKGPEQKDKKLLHPAGRLILGGLIRGVREQIPELEKLFRSIGPMNIQRTFVATAASVAGNGALAASLPALAPSTSTGLRLSPADIAAIGDAVAKANVRSGIGEISLDGEKLNRNQSKRTGRTADLRRKTG